MTTERDNHSDQHWFDYVSGAPESGDESLRETLMHACPDCAQDLARSEAIAAGLALSLERLAPPPELKERMLKRLTPAAAVKNRVYNRVGSSQENPPELALPSAKTLGHALGPVTGPASGNASGPASGNAEQYRSSQPQSSNNPPLVTTSSAPYPKRNWLPITLSLGVVISGLLILTWSHHNVEQRVEQGLASLQQAQKENATNINEALERLARTRLMADALREKANQISVLERRNRDLEVELAAAKGPDPIILQAMREELEILQSPQLELHSLKTAVNTDAKIHLIWDKTGNRWMITGHGVPKLADNRCYGIWMKTDDGRMLPSVTFTPDSNGNVRVMMDVPVNNIMTGVAITDEPLGGAAKATGSVHFHLDLI
jgi:Anti-sigma-K factor rskA